MAERVQKQLQEAQAMEKALVEASTALAEEVVEGRSEDNKVKVRVSGTFEFVGLRITPGALEEESLPRLQDSVAQAIEAALAQARTLATTRRAATLEFVEPKASEA